jgi:hypothetical protein
VTSSPGVEGVWVGTQGQKEEGVAAVVGNSVAEGVRYVSSGDGCETLEAPTGFCGEAWSREATAERGSYCGTRRDALGRGWLSPNRWIVGAEIVVVEELHLAVVPPRRAQWMLHGSTAAATRARRLLWP